MAHHLVSNTNHEQFDSKQERCWRSYHENLSQWFLHNENNYVKKIMIDLIHSISIGLQSKNYLQQIASRNTYIM
jgi:N-formylglutamate amidohydrolase